VFIDATYEGDLMAKAGVSYTVGREGNEVYEESNNGIRKPLRLKTSIDPYTRTIAIRVTFDKY
ncbi:MAG: FAD-dependent oxidoreductase, partial [Paenibacillus sp.]|nr:FAD-dependent oxidoreductase [Paenibacillus sp.]